MNIWIGTLACIAGLVLVFLGLVLFEPIINRYLNPITFFDKLAYCIIMSILIILVALVGNLTVIILLD